MTARDAEQWLEISCTASVVSCVAAWIYAKRLPAVHGGYSADPEYASWRGVEAILFIAPAQILAAVVAIIVLMIGYRQAPPTWRRVALGLAATTLIAIWLNFFVSFPGEPKTFG